ncbi:hypothetical protein D0C36_12270 [Mucilaginibacter conchicola]|uniref:Zeta toxin domain-containing protein n=1 Tax=Mucilaginibacter conchicola TaxID=2303333 RepID=A0A372NSI6_9SPHI|nr:zeta toxin family protein [Mucilaginibacter conchicola]RFZ92208.1 hypothetical protein D0C36_12270 [Mucilaginibacter conchicola]
MPEIVVIGGPNGSGKTTLTTHLVQRGRVKTDVINPDSIALNVFGSYDHHLKAARVALSDRASAIDQLNDLAFETTFSGSSEIRDVKTAKAKGYKATLYFIALQSVLDNIIRVEERKTNLGHNVNLEDVVRRYHKSRINLKAHLSLFDKAYLFDNSASVRSRVAIFENGRLIWSNPKHKNHPFYTDILNS